MHDEEQQQQPAEAGEAHPALDAAALNLDESMSDEEQQNKPDEADEEPPAHNADNKDQTMVNEEQHFDSKEEAKLNVP